MKVLLAAAFALLTFSHPIALAEGLEATLDVVGRKVEVQVRHGDGRPAAGVFVRMSYGRQLNVAAARTDAQGRWVYTVDRTGAYEAVVENGPDGEDIIRIPFAALDTPAVVPFPWLNAFLAAACLGAAFLFLAVGIGSAVRKGVRPSWQPMLLVVALLSVGGGLFGWSAFRHTQESAAAPVPTEPDLAATAREFLRSQDIKPLSGPLEQLLADTTVERIKTQPHALLGQPAPDFELTDHRRQVWHLRERLQRGPVVLVFYYGYHCNHCVGQLFALHDDVQKFRELGAEVVAVSADPPEVTKDRFKKYGEFAFPVLNDPGNKVAQLFGVYRPALGKRPEELEHGTFVIGRDGLVHWAQYGDEPFTGNHTLLHELARLEGRLPAGTRE